MNAGFSEPRSAAIRAGLIAVAAGQQRQRPHWWRAVGLLTVGALAGAGAASAAFAAGGAPITHPAATSAAPSDGRLVPAPPGVVPGTPIVSMLGIPEGFVVEQKASFDISKRPEAATHARITITCLTAGITTFGTDAGGNNPSIECDQTDPATAHNLAWQDFEIGSAAHKLYFTTSEGAKASVSVQFLNQLPTRLGVNTNGQTYGAMDAPEGQPDLVWTTGKDINGQDINGYGRSVDLDAFSPDHPSQPTSPAEAVRLQAERDQEYPNGWNVPLFKSDGETQIGSFHVG